MKERELIFHKMNIVVMQSNCLLRDGHIHC